MKTKRSAYNCRCRCSNLTKLSLSNPLLKWSTNKMTMLHWLSLLWDHKFDAFNVLLQYHFSWDHKFGISKTPCHFTMRRPPYISLERPNHLRYSWDRLRILLHQLWIFIRSILELRFESNQLHRWGGVLPNFPQQHKISSNNPALPQNGAQSVAMLPQRRERKGGTPW